MSLHTLTKVVYKLSEHADFYDEPPHSCESHLQVLDLGTCMSWHCSWHIVASTRAYHQQLTGSIFSSVRSPLMIAENLKQTEDLGPNGVMS